MLRRSELANLRDDPLVRCVHLPPRLTLARYLAAPDRAQIVWRTFFAAAHAALSGAVPALKSGDHPTLGAGEPPALALPLARCGAAGCGGRGCEPAAGAAAPRCGCAGSPPALAARAATTRKCGGRTGGPRLRRPQPRCPQDCLRRGDCDWQGLPLPPRLLGLDCALTRGADGAPVVTSRRAAAARRRRPPRVYVLDMPPLLRFGNPFAPHFGAKLKLRFLRGAQRAADRERRSASSSLACHSSSMATGCSRGCGTRASTSPCGTRRGRHTPSSSSERAQYDALQLSSNADDRETWPPALLARAPHAAGILAIVVALRLA